MEGNRNILVYGLPIVTLIVLGVLALHSAFPEHPGLSTGILYAMLLLGSIVLVFLVLIQRGKGGGLAGALGGMGGSSAFGTRAGDVFTMITIVAASFWILSAMALAKINLAAKSGKYQGPTIEKSAKSLGLPSSVEPDEGTTTDGEKSEMPAEKSEEGKGVLEDKPGAKSDSNKDDSN